MRRIKRCSALVLLTFQITPGIKAAETTVAASPPPNVSTCATGSVNWITHTLPQQCLKTSWTSSFTANRTDRHDQVSSIASSDARDTATLPSSETTPTFANGASQVSDLASFLITQLAHTAHSTPITDLQPSTLVPESQGNAVADEETAADSALQNANFLSFEEWKQQKLGDAGQSAEALAKARGSLDHRAERQRPGAALDTLGEDSEIDLDFSGFGGSTQDAAQNRQGAHPESLNNARSTDQNVAASGPSGARSKDAGRTCKERFNYATFDCAANVLKTNPKCKSSSSVLVENKDSYMLNECSMDNKFLIVELCEYIQIDTVVLANFEFFSSMFRTFRISVSDRYPVKIDKWQELGTYEARNSREIQAFLIENPLIWAKYIRIEFLTHYGSEFYCPLSLLRVHGTTMMEDYRHQEELARGEADSSEEELELSDEVVAVPAVISHIAAPEIVTSPAGEDSASESVPTSQHSDQVEGGAGTTHAANDASQSDMSDTSVSVSSIPPGTDPTSSPGTLNTSSIQSERSSSPIPQTSTNEQFIDGTESVPTRTAKPDSGRTPSVATSPAVDSQSNVRSTLSGVSTVTSTSTVVAPVRTAIVSTSVVDTARSQSHQDQGPAEASLTARNVTATSSTKDTVPDKQSTHGSTVGTGTGTATNITASAQGPNHSTQSSTSSVADRPASSQPATQESFFKTLSKRLSLLEANATLSLQYIESQSSLLRDAFTAVEKRQIQKTTSFLASLNETVLKELAAARVDYDQLWQSTVLELADQRDEGRREREILNERVRLLAEELVGQKRLMAAQATLLFIVLVLVVFTKVAPGQASEVATGLGVGDIRILQGMQALVQRGRSGKRTTLQRPASNGTDDESHLEPRSRSRWGWDSPFAHSPGETRPTTGHGMDESHEDAWDDLLAFVDENVRPRQGRATSYLKQKPLPPAPRPELVRSHSGLDESDANDSSAVDTPSLRHDMDGVQDDGVVDESPGLLGVAGRMPLGRRASAVRAAKSAPTTPRTEHSPMLDGSVDEVSAGSGASSGGESIGLGIELE